MIVVRMARLERLVTVSFIFMLLIVTIVSVYGLSEEEAEEFYQKFKEFQEGLIDQVDRSTVEYYTEGEVSNETLKAMNIEEYAARKEVVSNREFIEEFKSVYNKTNGFTENLEAWGALFKEFNIKYRNRIIETTEIPESRDFHQKLKEEVSLMKNEALGNFHFWEPKTGAEVMAELEATTTTTNNTEVVRAGASTLEEQLKLAQEKLEAAGVNGEFGLGLPREVPETQQNIKKPLCSLSYNSTNLKIIDIILPATGSFNPLCMLTVNDLLNTNYTIKGTFQDRYILLEKLK